MAETSVVLLRRWFKRYYEDVAYDEGESYFPLDISGVRIGSQNPNWRQQILHHEQAGTALTATEWKVHKLSPTMGYTVNLPHKEEVFDSSGLLTLSDDNLDWTSIDNKALVSAYRDIESSFQGATFLGELREAVRMLRNPALALRKGVDELIAQNRGFRAAAGFGQGKKYRKQASDAWLEWSFGAKPLINDISDLAAAVKTAATKPTWQKFSGRASSSSICDQKVNSWSTGAMHSFISKTAGWVTGSVRYKGEVRNKVSTPVATAVCKDFGFWPTQWVPTAWELIPNSFLVDYFLNIGDILNSWATFKAVDFAWTLATKRLETRSSTAHTVTSGQTGNDFKGVMGWGALYQKKVWRNPSVSLPLPILQVDTSWNFSRGLNIAALAGGRDWKR